MTQKKFQFHVSLANANLANTDFTNADLYYANLDGAYFQGGDLTGITYANCIGTPIGTPAFGTLPVYTAC
jgi:uncharacterized protein YjbI with pentapeptide repeats